MPKFKYEGRDLEAMSQAKNYHTWILDIFSKYLGSKVAEIGAGSGTVTELLAKYPDIKEIVAVEPSIEMYPLLNAMMPHDKRIKKHNHFYGDISKQYQEYFDSMIYVNVFEHIEDVSIELKHIKSSLKPGGHLCVFVPALQWLYAPHDASVGHFRRYHKNDLKKLIEASGLKVVSIRYFDMVGIIPWLIFYKWFKKKMSGNDASAYDKLIVPILRLIDPILPMPIGKNLIVIAKK